MPNHHTFLRCSRTTALIIITISAILFLLVGCAALFKSAGLTDDQAIQQTEKLKAALAEATATALTDIQTGLAEGHDLKTLAINTSTSFIWKIIAGSATSVGVILNGLLAKWLGTEKKITKTLIKAIETADTKAVKQFIRNEALASGIEKKLHKRVASLT